jgi:hypothetical protein
MTHIDDDHAMAVALHAQLNDNANGTNGNRNDITAIAIVPSNDNSISTSERSLHRIVPVIADPDKVCHRHLSW